MLEIWSARFIRWNTAIKNHIPDNRQYNQPYPSTGDDLAPAWCRLTRKVRELDDSYYRHAQCQK